MKSIPAAALLLGLVAVSARAGIDVEVGNGDQVSGTLGPATEVETFRVRVPAGAKLTVKAKAAKKGPPLHVTLADPLGGGAGSADGKSASIGVVTTSSGVHTVTVTSEDGTSTGGYSLSISWKSATSFTATADLATGATSTLAFAADAGAVATISARPARRSAATAVLGKLTAPDASETSLTGTSAKPTLATGGGWVLEFGNSGATTGGVAATVKLKAPRPTRRKVALTSSVIGSGDALGDTAISALVGPAGGTVTVPLIGAGQPGSEISGASVTIPVGALPLGTAIYIATAPDIALPVALSNEGPTVFFGPEGTRFDKSDRTARATVVIPYDANFGGSTSTIVVYTRDAKGRVTEVPKPYTFDTVAHTVSFATSHFSAFQAIGQPPAFTLNTLATVGSPIDVCPAFDPAVSGARIKYFVTDGDANTVVALREGIVQPGSLVVPEVYAGGGADPTPGASRLQFRFVDAIFCVQATSDGHLWIGTQTQIFEVDGAGAVQLRAGTGTFGDTGDDGPALSATFKWIRDILVTPSRQIYVLDPIAHRIRFIDLSVSGTGNVTAWAGTGSPGLGQDGIDILTTSFPEPRAMAMDDAGTGLYVTDASRVRHLGPGAAGTGINVTIAGSASGSSGNTGDGGPLLSALFEGCEGIVRYQDPFHPSDVVLIVSDFFDHTLRKLDLTTDTVTLVGGQHAQSGFGGDLDLSTGLLDGPMRLFAEANDIVFVDANNKRVRVQTLLE